MPSYRLLDDGMPYKKIVTGRKWVGRVYQKSTGTWVAVLNGRNIECEAATPEAAFRLAAAKGLGFDSPDAVLEHNRGVRAQRSANRAAFNQLLQRVARGR